MSETTLRVLTPAEAKCFRETFSALGNPFSMSSVGEDKQWPRVLAVLSEELPCTVEGWRKVTKGDKEVKRKNLSGLIIAPLTAGFSKVPIDFRKNKYVVDHKTAQPLSEIVAIPEGHGGDPFKKIRCFPYTIVPGAPKSKQARVENLGFEVEPGMTVAMTVWPDTLNGTKKEKDMFPKGMDTIPAFTPVILTLAIKVRVVSCVVHVLRSAILNKFRDAQGWSDKVEGQVITVNGVETRVEISDVSPAAKGYGMSPVRVETTNGTLYSLLDCIPPSIMASYEDVVKMQASAADKYPAIAQCLPQNTLPFFVDAVSPTATIEYVEGGDFVRIEGFSNNSSHGMDVAVEDLLRLTNSTALRGAMCLLELCKNTGCLSALVWRNNYRVPRKRPDDDDGLGLDGDGDAKAAATTPPSVLYGAPIIDYKRLLSCLGDLAPDAELVNEGGYISIQLAHQIVDAETGETFQPILRITAEAFAKVGDEATMPHPPSPDMPLVGAGHAIGRCHFLRIVHPTRTTGNVLYNGYYSLGRNGPLIGGNAATRGILGAASEASRKYWAGGDDEIDPFAEAGGGDTAAAAKRKPENPEHPSPAADAPQPAATKKAKGATAKA